MEALKTLGFCTQSLGFLPDLIDLETKSDPLGNNEGCSDWIGGCFGEHLRVGTGTDVDPLVDSTDWLVTDCICIGFDSINSIDADLGVSGLEGFDELG